MINIVKKLRSILKKNKITYLIDSDDYKDFLIYSLKDEKILGLDTEFDWRKTYFPTLCLLQIATKKNVFLIDCIKCKDLIFLKQILEDKKKLLIFHSSRSDATVLNTNLKIKVKNIFDIQIAEKLLFGGEIKNYGTLVKNYLNIFLKKSETNSNWLNRPFSSEQLSYASEDVSYLIEIYQEQKKVLKKKNLFKKTLEKSKKEVFYGNQELHISRLKKLKKISKIEKKIFLWRESYASKNNIPPSHVLRDKELKNISKEIKNHDKKSLSSIFNNKKAFQDFIIEMNI